MAWYGSASAGRVPVSCDGSALVVGEGFTMIAQSAKLVSDDVLGRLGSPVTGLAKLNMSTGSEQTSRRHGLMLPHTAGLPIAVDHCSMNWATGGGTWSKRQFFDLPRRKVRKSSFRTRSAKCSARELDENK